MNNNKLFIVVLVFTSLLWFSGCIKSEAPNAEADILAISIDGAELRMDPTITNDAVMVLVYKDLSDLSAIAPTFTLTPGATINPASGTTIDFSGTATGESTGGKNTHRYVVTAENGVAEKEYKVTITDEDIPTKYDFENWVRTEEPGRYIYETPYEPIFLEQSKATATSSVEEFIQLKIWSSGNAGYAIVGGKSPSDFPTCSTTDKRPGSAGNLAAKLETKLTGYIPMPLAAGNLFLGSFFGRLAMEDAMRATRFGVPFNQKPERLRGFFKYKAGTMYKKKVKEGDKEVLKDFPELKDIGDIYAVLYYKDMPGTKDPIHEDNDKRLNGTNVKTSDRIIALAQVDIHETDSYVHFDVEFDYDNYSVEFDKQLMTQHKYYLGIVCSASDKGAQFEGAPGSTLFVDDLEVVCAPKEQKD